MNKFLVGLAAGVLMTSVAFAQAPAPAAKSAPAPAAKAAPAPAPAPAAPVAAAAGGSCADRATGKNGKALAGAAKGAFMKKCEADVRAAK